MCVVLMKLARKLRLCRMAPGNARKFDDPRQQVDTWNITKFTCNDKIDQDAVIDIGQAAMVGYGMGYLVDSARGAGLVDQQSNFLGKLLLVVTVLSMLLIWKNSDVESLRTMAKESTFFHKQWQATWKDDNDKEIPSSS